MTTKVVGSTSEGLTQYVQSVAELEAIAGSVIGQSALVRGSEFRWDGTTWSPEGYVTVEAFGADPSISDNASALRDAIESGYPIDWGDKQYQVQGRVGADSLISHNIKWKSNGAKVVLDPAVTHQADLIAYRINGGEHKIEGDLTIDASSKANICFGIRNNSNLAYPSGYATFSASNLKAINSRRESGFRAGGGIRIEGAFLWILLESPKVYNAVMASGSGIQGISGITGIDCTRDSSTGLFPLYTEINNPDIDGVESEDLAYEFDQDGIKVFGGLSATDLLSSFLITGGKFRNCFGRSIKSQATTGTVVSPKFIRNRGFTSGIGNPEIDFQGGMGFVHDITCEYDGFVPANIVAQRSTDRNRAQGLVDGVAVKISNAVLPAIVSTFSTPPMAPVICRNFSADGAIDYAVQLRSPQAISYLTLEDFDGSDIREGLVKAVAGGIDVEPQEIVKVDIRRAFNTGTPVLAVRQRIPGNAVTATISADKVIGFTGGEIITADPDEATGPKIVKRLDALTMTQDGDAGFLEMQGEFILAGATEQFKLPPNGMAFFAARFSNSIALFSFSTVSGGRLGEIFSGSSVSIGTASEPAANDFQVWPDTTNSLINVKNNTGGSRVATIMYFTS